MIDFERPQRDKIEEKKKNILKGKYDIDLTRPNKIKKEDRKKVELEDVSIENTQSGIEKVPKEDSKFKIPKFNMRYIKYLKNSLAFYWHTGEKKLALVSGGVAILFSSIVLLIEAGGSAFVLIMMLFFEKLLVIFFTLYLLIFRSFMPSVFTHFIDKFFIPYIGIMILLLILDRVIINIVAEKFFGYDLINNKPKNNR